MTESKEWNRGEILDVLSESAERFDFPILDNANWNYVTGRIRGFRAGTDWGLTFELFIFNVPAACFCIQVYGYGPLINSAAEDLGAIEVVSECSDDPLWDDDGNWRPWSGARDVVIAGRLVRVSTSAESTHDLMLSAGDADNELRFAAALIRELGCAIVFGDDPVKRLGIDIPRSSEVFRLAAWDHPDVAGGATIRESKALLAAATALSGDESAWKYDHARDNSDWRFWASGKWLDRGTGRTYIA